VNSVYADADEKKVTLLVGLDLSAAFDTINHDVLISRLESQFGVDGGASSWLRSYLTDRQQFVKLGDHSSTTAQCASGVPQGSVLGPLLFTAYVSPVRELIESHGVSYHQFADDTHLLVAMNVTDAGPALERLANAQPLFDCGSCITTYNSTQTSLRSFLALHRSSSRLLISAKSRSSAAGCRLRQC